jgi:hypothetical protein
VHGMLMRRSTHELEKETKKYCTAHVCIVVCEDGKPQNNTDSVTDRQTERHRDRKAERQITEHTHKSRGPLRLACSELVAVAFLLALALRCLDAHLFVVLFESR